MLKLNFTFHFDSPQRDFYLNRTLYRHGFLMNDFFVLDLYNSSFSFMALNDDEDDDV